MDKKGKGFMICPVRGVDPSTSYPYVRALEREGWEIHWPHRDTDQNDRVGLRICEDNLAAMWEADVVFVVWDGKSQGCLFDLGMAFALGKKIACIQLPPPSGGKKGFQNMARAWAKGGRDATDK